MVQSLDQRKQHKALFPATRCLIPSAHSLRGHGKFAPAEKGLISEKKGSPITFCTRLQVRTKKITYNQI